MNTEINKSANEIARLAEKIFPNITVRKAVHEYVFTLNGHYHTAYSTAIVDAASGENLNVLARTIAIDFFKLKLDEELS